MTTRTEPTAPSHSLILGELVHRAVAEIAGGDLGRPATEIVETCWPIAIRLSRARPLGTRARAAKLTVASLTAVYIRYFLPPKGWTLLAAELDLGGDGRVDLAWSGPRDEILFDEVKVAAALGQRGDDGPGRRQAARYAANGSRRCGDRFAGVRLVLLGAPRHSMLVGPGDRLRRLADTEFWFERDEPGGEAAR